jgi:PAS domain S-box-containing protein
MRTIRFPEWSSPRLMAAALLAILAAGALFAWWEAARADREMRADLLQQARLVMQAVEIERVQALSGTEADLDSPAYRQLKEQLAAVRSANQRCRFVYLMGRKADGTVFFFLDSEPAGSADYSPPGQVYEEVPAGYRRVFDTKTEAVEGPVPDRWGVWVSALVPLTNPRTGAVVAVLGMDIDARAWKWDVAARAALPVGLMLVMLIGVAAAFVSARRVDASPKPVLRRLLPPLTAMVILLMAGAGALLYQQNRQHLAGEIAAQVSELNRDLRTALDQQTVGLAAVAQPIATDANVKRALREGDASRLLSRWRPVFESLRREYHLTHLNFIAADRVLLLRVHQPELRGDIINRATTLEAERSGKTASGIESGTVGAFTLRVVQPVFEGGVLVGYVELGKEIEEVLRALHARSSSQLAVVIRKEHMNRLTWEDAMRLLGREADWDRLPRSVVIYASQGRLPDAFAPWADNSAGEHAHGETDREIAFDGRDWRVSATPLQDAWGTAVGDLLIMRDISSEKAAFARLMALGGTAGAVLLALLLSFIYVLLRRTDTGIRAQQAELRASEERLSATLRSIGDGVIACDAGDNVVSLNAAAETLTGWSAAEARGRSIAEVFRIFDTETRQAARRQVGRALREDGIIDPANHTTLIARDGAERQIADSCAPIHDAAGGGVGVVFAFRDVTAEYRQREQLLESEEKHRLLIENSHDIIYTLTADGVFTFVSPAWTVFLGHPVTQVVGQPFQQFVHPDDLAGCMVFLRAAIETGQRQEDIEYRVRHTDGSWYWHTSSAVPLRDEAGTVVGFEGIARDITERKRAEDALRESEQRYRLLVETASEGILVAQDTGLKFVNPMVLELTGRTEEELISLPFLELVHRDDRELARDNHLKRLRGEAVDSRYHLRILRRDKSVKWVEMSGTRIEWEGRPATMDFVTDITNRKRAEEELLKTNRFLEAATARANELTAQAEMASIAKSEFLANMSHEIRTPMNGVIGMTGLLLDTELNEEQRRYTEIVRASSDSLLGLINDILDFSKIEAKKLDLETMDFNLPSLLDDFAATLAVRAHEKGLELLCAADPAVPELLRGDPGRLRQILTNLAGNAVKFTHQGEIAVRASLVSETDAEAVLRFSIKDTGIGIPAEKHELMFQKFTQADASTTRRYGGTGLGLAISKQLTELMGGRIGVSSEEGKGSEFWFTVRLGKQAEGAQAECLPPADLRNVRALIVDDNATSREILTTRLASWGMRPSEAQDGPGALQVLHRALEENDPFRLVVIDMQMPGMDGETLGGTIKADERLADTRMVMLTSLGTRGDTRRLKGIGFAAYLTKPARHQELKAVLSLALTERGGAEPMPRPIATRHTARETLNLFADRKARILLAEDNITNQQVALGILKKLGLRADAVANGAEALNSLETIPYDLVLMDVQMPVMDGLEATQRIREARSAVPNHGIPIIAMTAHAMRGDLERCLAAGMDDYVSKPVAPQALADVLEKWLPKEQGESGIARHSSAVFDREALLERLMGDEDLAGTIADGFLRDIPRQIQALKDFLDAGNAPGAERQVHTIKGASASVGGEALRAVAHEMEMAGRAGDLAAVKARMADLEAQFDRLKEAIGVSACAS